jgi:hypothetical protein
MRISSEGDGVVVARFEGLAGGSTAARWQRADRPGRGDGRRTNSLRAEMARASKHCEGDARAATAA